MACGSTKSRSCARSTSRSSALMQGMLSLLLFAGALHVDMRALSNFRLPVIALAIVGTLLSTFIVGFGLWIALPFVGVAPPLSYCLLFGALISPTDPIAVIGILKSAGAPKDLEVVITGESLFNDGVGVVLFSLLLGVLATGTARPSAKARWLCCAKQAVAWRSASRSATSLFASSSPWITTRSRSCLRWPQSPAATRSPMRYHVSGPLAMVVTGLIVGNDRRALAMSDTTRRYVDMFWELVDEILNAVLFVLLGMEILLVDFRPHWLVAACVAVAVTLVARGLSVGVPMLILERPFGLPSGSWKVLTWGGLRGGISVALALSLPGGSERDAIVAFTYCTVLFSVLVQGLSIGYVTRTAIRRVGEQTSPANHAPLHATALPAGDQPHRERSSEIRH